MTEETCYALVLYIYYGWDECEETFAVSFSQDKLRNEYANITHRYSKQPLAEDARQHLLLTRNEQHHWAIKPIKFLA